MINIGAAYGPRRLSERRRLWLATAVVVAATLSANSGCSHCNEIGPDADAEANFPRWMRQLKDPDPEKRAEAMEMVGLLSGRHSEAVAQAVSLLADPDARVRRKAAMAFGAFREAGEATRRAAEKAKPALVGALRDRDSKVREEAVASLSLLSGSTKSEVLALAACLSDPDRGVRDAAAGAFNYLGSLGVDATAAVPALEAAVGDPDQFVRSAAAMALGRIGAKRPSTVAALTRAVGQGRTEMVGYGFTPALSLGMIGPEAKSAALSLRLALKSEDGLTRATAAWALWRVSADQDVAVPVLVECLGSRRNPIVATGEPPRGGTEPDTDARRLAAAALLEISRSSAASRKVVDAALKNIPADEAAEVTEARKTLIEDLQRPDKP